MATKALLVCSGILALSACASSGAPPAAQGTQASATQSAPGRRDASLITREDLNDPAVRSLNVIEAIRVLRPNFLVNRGTQTIVNDDNKSVTDAESGLVHASVDDSGVLPVDELRRIQAGAVREIRLLSPAAAMQRFGATARQGPVIVVKTM
jgi:hypothetical protein